MTTINVTLPDKIAKKIDTKARDQGFATRADFIRSLLGIYLGEEIEFKEFKKKPLEKVRAEFEKTGKYNKKFIDSLIKGLSESSPYADKANKN